MRIEKKSSRQIFVGLLVCICCFAIALLFVDAAVKAGKQHRERELLNLEASIHRAAAACYAVEGAYPPDLAYLEQHYGIQINKDRYTVFYDAIAENLMPDITVMEREK